MTPPRMSRGKRLGKPLLFGAVLLGLGTVFINRHRFLTDVEELRAKARDKYEMKRLEVEEARQRQLAELAEKRKSQ
ncbi:hypothetical protein NDU88_008386 [Pleurodeles waltl]|uniref:Uncharacterized protein n=1 Tax=Pleurodeles waltl TaxID=8319 RepID=A0AAV7PSR6_PLEWA|nr:hypothetical protein NDU88_008386 [Pleurodeles waltl]